MSEKPTVGIPSHPFEDTLWPVLPQSICDGRPDVIRKEARPFRRIRFGVRLCWELEEPKGPKGINHKLAVVRDPSGFKMKDSVFPKNYIFADLIFKDFEK